MVAAPAALINLCVKGLTDKHNHDFLATTKDSKTKKVMLYIVKTCWIRCFQIHQGEMCCEGSSTRITNLIYPQIQVSQQGVCCEGLGKESRTSISNPVVPQIRSP